MSPKRDAFGRPIEPSAPGSAPRNPPTGSRAAPRARVSDGDAGATPVVGGLPPADGGPPVAARPAGFDVGWRDTRRVARKVGGFLALAIVVGAGLAIDIATEGPPPDRRPPEAASAAPVTPPKAPLLATRAARDAVAIRRAMRRGESISSVSLDAETSYAQMIAPGGAGSRFITVDPGGTVTSLEAGSGARTAEGSPVADFDPAAPRRLMAAVARGLGPGSSGAVVSLFATSAGTDPLEWSATVGGTADLERRWRGDEHGRSVVRLADGAPAPAVGEVGPATVPTGTTGRSLPAPSP